MDSRKIETDETSKSLYRTVALDSAIALYRSLLLLFLRGRRDDHASRPHRHSFYCIPSRQNSKHNLLAPRTTLWAGVLQRAIQAPIAPTLGRGGIDDNLRLEWITENYEIIYLTKSH